MLRDSAERNVFGGHAERAVPSGVRPGAGAVRGALVDLWCGRAGGQRHRDAAAGVPGLPQLVPVKVGRGALVSQCYGHMHQKALDPVRSPKLSW